MVVACHHPMTYLANIFATALSSVLLLGGRLHDGVPALQADSTGILGLRLVELPVPLRSGSTMAVILSGEGGWVGVGTQMAASLVARGLPVVGLDTPAYLDTK